MFTKFGTNVWPTARHVPAKFRLSVATAFRTRNDVREKSIEKTRVGLRFFDAKLKRLCRSISNLVSQLRPSTTSCTRNFSRARASVRPLCHAYVSRGIARRSYGGLLRFRCRLITVDDIDVQFRALLEHCRGDAFDDFHANRANRSTSPALSRAHNEAKYCALCLHFTTPLSTPAVKQPQNQP